MTVFVTLADLQAFEPTIDAAKAAAMIADATAIAILQAPCIDDVGFTRTDAVKAILRGAILRWHEAGAGSLQAETVGPFTQAFDTRTPRRGLFWPSELTQLQGLCTSGSSFTLGLAGPDPVV